MDGDAKGVAGKNGVPAAESHLGVCPVSPLVAAVPFAVLGAFGSGNTLLKPLYSNQAHRVVQRIGIDRKINSGTAHGRRRRRTKAIIELSSP